MRKARYLVLGLVVSLAGCGGDEKSNGNGSPDAGGGGGLAGSGGASGSGGTGGAGGTGGSAGTGGVSSGGTGGITSDPDAGDASTAALSVTAVDLYVTDTGTTTVAADISQYDATVLVHDGQTFSTHPPTLTEAGHFEVETLPSGDRYVRFNKLGDVPTYFMTSATELDLGLTHLGRPDVQPESAGTELALELTGMEAWQDGDQLQLHSAGARTALFGVEKAAPPTAGDLAVSGLTIDYTDSTMGLSNLIEGAKDDQAFVLQLSRRTLPNTDPYRALSRIFTAPSFTLTDGQATTISGAFVEPNTTGTVAVDWKGSQFEDAITQGNPTATITARDLGGFVQLHPEEGFFGPTPDLFYYPAPATDLVATFTFANPFTSPWEPVVMGRVAFTRAYTVSNAAPLNVLTGIQAIVEASSSVTMRPLVGPVQNLTIGGQDALVDASGVGTMPVVSFDAPSIGTPNGYEVVFYRLSNSNGLTSLTMVGRVVTTSQSFVVPPGIFSSGNQYFLSAISFVRGSIDMNQAPQKITYPQGDYAVLSGIISP